MPPLKHLDRCWMIPKSAPLFILLGRNGDLIQMLPAFELVKQRTGLTPYVMVSDEYCAVLEGVNYATPWIVPGHWYGGMGAARQLAAEKYGTPIVLPWWHMDRPDVEPGPMVLQSHGIDWGVNMGLNPDYGTSMWHRAGFTRQEMMAAKLNLDRRNLSREALLAQTFFPARPTLPVLLVNFSGISSPFGFEPELRRVLFEFKALFHIVDLANVRGYRIFDLLGLYDRAAGLLTVDTSTLHLAATGTIPYIAFTVDGWSSSVPKGDCRLEVKYSQTRARLDQVRATLKEIHSHAITARLHPIQPQGLGHPTPQPDRSSHLAGAALG